MCGKCVCPWTAAFKNTLGIEIPIVLLLRKMQVFYLRFSKTATSRCSIFVYYSWESPFFWNLSKYAGVLTYPLIISIDLWQKVTLLAFWAVLLKQREFIKISRSVRKEELLFPRTPDSLQIYILKSSALQIFKSSTLLTL